MHFSRGSAAALLSLEATGDNATISFNDVCVDFEAGEVNADACADFDTSDVGFIDLPAGGETDFPADFPEQPTFNADEADNN
ncbi:MAG TPA: hypothetical protein VNT79_08180 [Phycisphaerae bacterium]|nr:hypothetical protein [Phycisphaerae bacterium]